MDVGQAITEAMMMQRAWDYTRLTSMWHSDQLRASLARAVGRGLITEGQAQHIRSQLPW